MGCWELLRLSPMLTRCHQSHTGNIFGTRGCRTPADACLAEGRFLECPPKCQKGSHTSPMAVAGTNCKIPGEGFSALDGIRG